LIDVWAGLHAATGLSRREFESLTIDEVAALQRAVAERFRVSARRDANLYALLCNLLASGKKRFTQADFLPSEEGEVDPVEAAAGLARYFSEVEETKKRSAKSAVDSEQTGEEEDPPQDAEGDTLEACAPR
jgi:hypothetical protein